MLRPAVGGPPLPPPLSTPPANWGSIFAWDSTISDKLPAGSTKSRKDNPQFIAADPIEQNRAEREGGARGSSSLPHHLVHDDAPNPTEPRNERTNERATEQTDRHDGTRNHCIWSNRGADGRRRAYCMGVCSWFGLCLSPAIRMINLSFLSVTSLTISSSFHRTQSGSNFPFPTPHVPVFLQPHQRTFVSLLVEFESILKVTHN